MKYVCLTFDDGLKSHIRNVVPALKEYGFKGTFFISGQLVDLKQHCYLSWDEIRELDAMGHEIGNHFYFHNDYSLNTKIYASISIQTMERRLASKGINRPRSLSYPGFHVNKELKEIVKDHGYSYARSGLEKILNFEEYQSGGSGEVYTDDEDHYQIQCLGVFGKKYGKEKFSEDLNRIKNGQVGVFCFHDIYRRISERPLIKEPDKDTDITLNEFKECLKIINQNKFQVILMKDIGQRIKCL